MNTREQQLEMITDCENRSEHLSDYDARAIDDFSHYMDRGGFLSEKQDDLLDKIWNKVTEKGCRL